MPNEQLEYPKGSRESVAFAGSCGAKRLHQIAPPLAIGQNTVHPHNRNTRHSFSAWRRLESDAERLIPRQGRIDALAFCTTRCSDGVVTSKTNRNSVAEMASVMLPRPDIRSLIFPSQSHSKLPGFHQSVIASRPYCLSA